MKKIIKHLSNLKDAFRVLEIIDHMGGVDIEKVTRDGLNEYDYWQVKPKRYLSGTDARDLQTIGLHKKHYSKESKLFRWLFYRNCVPGSRDFYSSFWD